jgi:hypothetical protein
LVQITRTTPRRWITLHLSQIFFTDALTFIAFSSFQPLWRPAARPQDVPYKLGALDVAAPSKVANPKITGLKTRPYNIRQNLPYL